MEPPFIVGVSGPKGEATARQLGVGVFASNPVAGFDPSVWLVQGTVVGDDEDADSDRLLRAAGPGAAIAYHAGYQRRRPGFDALPGAAVWRESVEAVDPVVRHLEVHRGHLTALNRHDEKVMTPRVAVQLSRSGTAAAWRQRLAEAEERGATEVAFQPAGDDLRGELAALMAAARSSTV
jgi:5,10-methylenetetrahydromethanopterin reductase